MNVSDLNYNRLARGVGVLLTLMGGSLLTMYGLFMATGINALADNLPGVDAIGFMFVASIGAFALPIGGFLLWGGPETRGRLRIAAAALGLMALIRLVAFSNPDVRVLVGNTPLVEFFVLGAIAVVSWLARPASST